MTSLRVLSLTQPWASLMAAGVKRIETRSWATRYRGPLAIHAAKGQPPAARELELISYPILTAEPHPLPRGAIVAVVRLVDCVRTEDIRRTLGDAELTFGDYSDGRYAWVTDRVSRLTSPIRCGGALGLWSIPDGLMSYLERAVREVQAFE